jgi:RNA polymerase sigma-70 factor (ECF subfamily)
MTVGGDQGASHERVEELLAQAAVLLRYAVTRVGDRQTAEDLVQETLVAAIEKADEFAARSSMRTWLIGILRHKILDHHRWRRRHPADQPSAALEGEEPGDEAPFTRLGTWRVDPNAGLEVLDGEPARAVDRARLRAALQLCIDRLPKSLHGVFVLRELEELEPDEVCREAGIASSSLAVLLYRARQALRACLQKRWVDA